MKPKTAQIRHDAQHAIIGAQRDELLRWREGGRMSDECLRTLQHELDLEERTLPAASPARIR
jgi:monovalent cation/hydrogen antiporter